VVHVKDPWKELTDLQDLNCSAVATSPPIPGGINAIEENDEVRAAASFAADEINVENRRPDVNGQKWFTLTKINSPTHQVVVSGYMYRMEIVLKQSECLNIDRNLGSSVIECPPVQGGVTRRCRVKVYQHWGNGYSLESSDCTVN
ncbi:hypothetical protein LOTGIDRAFT_176677, partial [Lottia gigantea]